MNIAETRQQLLEDIQHIRQTVSLEFKTLSEAQLLWKPAPERWGILECLVHLNAASQYYTNQLKLKFSQTPIRSSATDFEMSFNGKMMLGFVDPASPRKIPSPGMFKPKPYHLDAPKVLERYFMILQDLENAIQSSEGVDWNQKIISPFTALLKFRLGDVFLFVVAHHQRHLNQAMRVKQESSFPR